MSKFVFTNRSGNQLAGNLELPAGPLRNIAIFAHCFTCSKNAKAAKAVAQRLASLGVGVLRFDFTGLGNSEGDFANTNFTSNVDDLIDAAAALTSRSMPPALLVGHSLGGAACLIAAEKIESVKAVATIGAPSEPAHVERLIESSTTTSHDDGTTTILLGGRELNLGSDFVEDLKQNRIADSLPSLKKPLMIFHSPVDSVVSIDNARRLYEVAKHPKNFVSIDGADHMLTRSEDANFVADTLAAWATRYLLNENALDQPADVEHGTVVVQEVDDSFTQSIQAGHHHLVGGEPVDVGGVDKGPTPYELLLASLGTCTSMTLRMYAKHKGISLKGITVRLKHSRIHAQDCESCESEAGKIDRIEKEIIVKGDLSAEQVKRLGEIADRCPVHRTLTNEKLIETEITQE